MERRQDCWYNEVCQMDCECSSCVRFSEMKFLMEHSGLPETKQKPVKLIPEDCDYDAFTLLQYIKDDIVRHVESGKSLYIASTNTGNGKTSWAIKLLLKYFDEVWAGNGFRVRGVFVHVPTLLLQLKDFDNPLSKEYRDSLLNADFVVWDEIASNGISNYDYSQLLMYIDRRVFNDKFNVYTGNYITREELVKVYGNRLASRIWNLSDVVILNGKDRR